MTLMSNDKHLLLNKPSELSKDEFIKQFKDIYEHSMWVAEAAWSRIQENEQAADFDEREVFTLLLHDIVEYSSADAKLALLRLHPDLAGKAALSGGLTMASTSEQAGAGLDQCTPEELAKFTAYNAAYKAKFGFPFIMAVKGATRFDILSGFEARIDNTVEEEFKMAVRQVHKIACFRLADK